MGGGSGVAEVAGATGVIAMRDLQSPHVMNLAAAGTLASGTRLSVPQAGQVASIMLSQHSSYAG
ncbi:MAG TPA: hypothetical protein VHW23_28095 [Kofleriaceae bacterium]|jgi:hypothetical protein|nr:hypothetical protein [Kofleriaceae bacterium]